MDRRDFLKAAGVTGAAVVATGCDYNSPVPIPAPLNFLEDPYVPYENVLPYVVRDEQIVPGNPTFFSTRCEECPAACGVRAKNREGRIIHLEGNPDEPASNGGLCSQGTQGLQATYSADRFHGPLQAGKETTWDEANAAIGAAVKGAAGAVAWLGRYRSGATGDLLGAFVAASGGQAVHWEPLGTDYLQAAVKQVFGKDTVPTWDLSGAHTVVSFGADFTTNWIDPVAHSRQWADSRDPAVGGFVSRTVWIADRLGNAGVIADLHLAPAPGTDVDLALALAKLVADENGYSGPAKAVLSGVDPAAAASAAGVSIERLQEVAGYLAAHDSVIVPGGATDGTDPTALAVAALTLAEVCGNIGKSIRFGDELDVTGRSSTADVVALLEDCKAGKVKVLFVDDLDVVYALPADVGAAAALAAVEHLVVLANEENETTLDKAWVLPPGTTVETWGDAHPTTGRYVLGQATMRPLYDTRAVGDIVFGIAKAAGFGAPAPAAEGDEAAADAAPAAVPAEGDEPAAVAGPTLAVEHYHAWIQGWWKANVWAANGAPGDFDGWWTDTVRRGGFFKEIAPTGATFVLTARPAASGTVDGDGMTLQLFPHPFLADGRHANKPWAQEVPEPLSGWSWTTWAELSKATAESMGLDKKDRVKVSTAQGELDLDWALNPSVRDDVVAVVMGNGKEKGGRYTKWGANPMNLLKASLDEAGAMRFVSTKAKVARSGKKSKSESISQLGHIDQDGRPINFAVSIKDLEAGDGAGSIVPMHHPPVDKRLTEIGLMDMFPEPDHPTYRFALAVDLNRCTGCGSCMTACHSENNIPVVGPEEMRRSRYMGWIRLSRYWEGEGEEPDVRFQPVMCQHCSHAPCEGVCPVLATYHNIDGLNAMIYNRCVGTRYCANNCPYTARRFNFHTYRWPESFNLMLNPDVSTRDMGVMEKCTFCVQRLRRIKDEYRDDGETVPTDALKYLTACASACPSDALTFGNANDEGSEFGKLYQQPRAYAMLSELNTKPGVRYLARINHIESVAPHHGGHGGGHGEDHGGDHGDAGGHGDDHSGSDGNDAAGEHH